MAGSNQQLHYESDIEGRKGEWYESRCSRTTVGDYSRTTCILLETRDVIYVRVKLNALIYPGTRHDNARIENKGLTDWCYLKCLHNGHYYFIVITIACTTFTYISMNNLIMKITSINQLSNIPAIVTREISDTYTVH